MAEEVAEEAPFQEENAEEPPELEEVDLEQERLLQAAKHQKQQEWLEQVKTSTDNEKKPFIPWDEDCELPKPDEEQVLKRTELLMKQTESVIDEQPPTQDEPTEEEVEGEYTNLEELD